MRQIVDYKVAIGHSAETLEKDVQCLEGKGYEPLDSIYAGSFGQAFPDNEGFKGVQMVPMVKWSEGVLDA